MVRIDVLCRDRIKANPEFIDYKQQRVLQLRHQCLRCGACVVELVENLGSPTHLANAERAFCPPGQGLPDEVPVSIIETAQVRP